MSKSNRGIKKKIFLSHISIILISVVLTSIVFNVCLNIYLRYQTRSQLTSAAQIILKSINVKGQDNSIQASTNNEREEAATLVKINRILKQTETFLNIKYAVIGINDRVIFPRNIESEETKILDEDIIPSLNKKNRLSNLSSNNRILYFTAGSQKYAALIHKAAAINGKVSGNLVLYSDMQNSSQMTKTVNLILFSILLVTSAIALLVSNAVSTRISRPLLQLIRYARKIGDREYKPEAFVYEDDEIGELAGTMENMAQKLAAYDTTMKTFLQNASHELRTPLMSIQGYAEGIKLGVIEDKKEASQVIIDESKRLTGIVEDLLYLSKLDALQETIKLETLDAGELFKDCIDRVNGIALQKGIKINLNLSHEQIMIRADEEKLSRAIINILGNCLRYADRLINILCKVENGVVVITIEDDGPGFDKKELPNVFDRFYKGKGGKHGLGLAITKSIVEKHQGSIKAENSVQGGASFIINLPSK